MGNAGYVLLRVGFTVAPILAGLDKVFFNFLANWEMYLSPAVAKALPVAPQVFMRGVGIVEVIAGIIVGIKPRIGGLIVAAWLLLIIVNLILMRSFYDVALRDVGLMIGALSLALMSGKSGCCK